MRKFELLSRASLANLLGAAGGATVVVAEGETPGDPTPPAGDPPAGDPPAAPKPPETPTPPEEGEEGPEASAQVVTVADAKAISLDAAANARKAEGKRWGDVFASAEALADPSLAAFMLTHSPDASAEAVVGQLKSRAGGSKPGAAAAATIPDTNVDLGRGDPQAALGEGAAAGADADGGDAWAASSKRVFGSMPAGMKTGPADAGTGYGSITSGGSLPNSAGQRPTGN